MTWALFLVVPSPFAQESLRRYRSVRNDTQPCPLPADYHNADVVISERVAFESPYNGDATQHFDHDDERWPTCCACGYVFTERDEWQHNYARLYTRTDNSGGYTLRAMPVGALYEAPWLIENTRPPANPNDPNGFLSSYYWRDWYATRAPYMVQCPGRTAPWCPDQTASNGPGWVVTGTAPLLTARPSIGMPTYHGFLTNGVLSDDLEGRRYD